MTGSLTALQLEATGPASLAEVMQEVEDLAQNGKAERLSPIPTGFSPLDEILNGGIRPGELLMLGGAFGVGKTIWALQVARNAVVADPSVRALYICYEHDRPHLFSRLLCLESAERGYREDALTLRRLADISLSGKGGGLVKWLRSVPRYATVMQAIDSYADRLILAKASGDHTGLEEVRSWVKDEVAAGATRLLVVVDYLQKIPVRLGALEPETEVTTYLTQGLKELAMALGVQVIAIAASDRPGLKSKRMRLSDLRGSSALQYEADVGLILNNKYNILSREHMVYNVSQAEAMRGWVVFSVEKNRAGRNAVDMEFQLDAAHFRILTKGEFVRERLVDEKVVLE
ncbi:MAG: AAA family ATPase [Anaerolineae bacterium]|jgi:replicative DNA helicase|nr:AAA family ATPase [Anaerolineae bacterium]